MHDQNHGLSVESNTNKPIPQCKNTLPLASSSNSETISDFVHYPWKKNTGDQWIKYKWKYHKKAMGSGCYSFHQQDLGDAFGELTKELLNSNYTHARLWDSSMIHLWNKEISLSQPFVVMRKKSQLNSPKMYFHNFRTSNINWVNGINILIWKYKSLINSICKKTYRSSPTMIIGNFGLNWMCVSLVFFFGVTSCWHTGSYLLIFKSYTWTFNLKLQTIKKIIAWNPVEMQCIRLTL